MDPQRKPKLLWMKLALHEQFSCKPSRLRIETLREPNRYSQGPALGVGSVAWVDGMWMWMEGIAWGGWGGRESTSKQSNSTAGLGRASKYLERTGYSSEPTIEGGEVMHGRREQRGKGWDNRKRLAD